MIGLAPLEVLYEGASGDEVSLPERLRSICGPLVLRLREDRPAVVSNFVQTLDGVVTLDAGKSAGGPISGGNEHDRAVMGLLRAVSDAVVVGAGTLRSVPKHRWTPEYAYPALAADFEELRAQMDLPTYPLNVIVTASGDLAGGFAIMEQAEVPVLIVTTSRGSERASQTAPHAEIVAASEAERLRPADIIEAIRRHTGGRLFLLEAGPALMGQFLAERLVDEVFLTVAPQIAGRDDCERRPGLVAGREFAPADPRWGDLLGVRRAGDFLFLRYGMNQEP
jgi:riboflavin biosynthesis pyrimidine reductase